MSSRSSLPLVALLLAGCYATHAPWEHAAPDGSAISLRIDVSHGYPGHARGFLEVGFDGSYVASPPNELRVCTGTLPSSELGAWAELLERTGAFAREGLQGPDIVDGGSTTVTVASESGLETSFTLLGGPAWYDASLHPYLEWPQRSFESLELASCAPLELDPEASALRAWITPYDASAYSARIDVGERGAVRAYVGDHDFPADWEEGLEACEPLEDPRALWSAVLASAPFDAARSRSGSRRIGVSAETTVTLPDGATHPRQTYFYLDLDRAEDAALEAALLSLIETHCSP